MVNIYCNNNYFNYLKYLDLYGISFPLHYKTRPTYSTTIGVILSIISIFLVLNSLQIAWTSLVLATIPINDIHSPYIYSYRASPYGKTYKYYIQYIFYYSIVLLNSSLQELLL